MMQAIGVSCQFSVSYSVPCISSAIPFNGMKFSLVSWFGMGVSESVNNDTHQIVRFIYLCFFLRVARACLGSS